MGEVTAGQSRYHAPYSRGKGDRDLDRDGG